MKLGKNVNLNNIYGVLLNKYCQREYFDKYSNEIPVLCNTKLGRVYSKLHIIVRLTSINLQKKIFTSIYSNDSYSS